jgi:hypothetical protein
VISQATDTFVTVRPVVRVPWFLLFAVSARCSNEQDNFDVEGREGNTFVVEDPLGMARSAVLKICGSSRPLKLSNKAFTTETAVRCDARGVVQVTYKDGRKGDCLVPYVMRKDKQEWHFRLHSSWCQDLLLAPQKTNRVF